MTVSSQTSTATFVGNGVATAFPLPFRFFDNGDIRAYFIDSVTGAATQMVLGTDYTLIGAGEPEVDGNALSLLTTTAPLSSMRGLYVERVMQQVQETDIVNQGQFFASTHEDVFDRLTMLIQQANANSAGAIRVAIGDPEPARLAPAPSRANQIMGFDSQGDPIAVAPVSGSASDLALRLANNVDPAKGAGQVGFGGSLSYPAGSVGAALNVLEDKTKPGFMKEQRAFANFQLLTNIGNVARINAAILGGAARIAFVGDSILEGDRDGLYDNSTAAIVMRVLREQNKDVSFTFANFSLAGRGIGSYADPNYKGIASPDNPAVGFYRPAGNALNNQWPGGSVIGKSWIDHVKDFAPDLTIIMHGANDVSGIGSANAAVWKIALDYQNTWAKVPSVAMGTAALPAVSAGYQNEVQIAADVVRGIARERNHTLIDVNRTFCLLRDAVDVENPLYVRDDGFVSYPTGWVQDVGSTLAAIDGIGYALQGVGGALRNTQSADINLSAKFQMPNWATQVGALRYRSLGTAGTQYSAQVTSGAVFLYYGAAIIGSAVVSAIPNNTEVTLQVDVAGARHRVYLNGVKVIDVYDYGNVAAGKHGILVAGASGLVYDLVAHVGNNYVVGEQVLTDVDIYGINDFVSNPDSLGGNGINHPTKLANTVIWGHSFAPLIHHIRSLRSASLVDTIPTVRAVSTEVFDVANTTLQMEINGVIGLATGMLVTPTGAQAIVSDVRKVVGGLTIVVRVFHSPGAYFLTTNVTLPAGTWLVTASATFTKDGTPTYRNTLIVTAMRAI